MVKDFRPLKSPMNKNITSLFIVKNISFIQFSSCHTSDENFLASNFPQTTVIHTVVWGKISPLDIFMRNLFVVKYFCLLESPTKSF